MSPPFRGFDSSARIKTASGEVCDPERERPEAASNYRPPQNCRLRKTPSFEELVGNRHRRGARGNPEQNGLERLPESGSGKPAQEMAEQGSRLLAEDAGKGSVAYHSIARHSPERRMARASSP